MVKIKRNTHNFKKWLIFCSILTIKVPGRHRRVIPALVRDPEGFENTGQRFMSGCPCWIFYDFVLRMRVLGKRIGVLE